jgi:hypothetical protein
MIVRAADGLLARGAGMSSSAAGVDSARPVQHRSIIPLIMIFKWFIPGR